MVRIGLLEPEEPYELLDGELVYVSPRNPAHAGTIQRLNALLVGAYGDRAIVRPQLPVGGIADSIPEPDLAVGPATLDELERHPRADELWLVIEICASSRARDRQKSAIYARAGARATGSSTSTPGRPMCAQILVPTARGPHARSCPSISHLGCRIRVSRSC